MSLNRSHELFMVSEKFVFYYESVGENEPQGVANLDPRGMVARIYVGKQDALLHTKYRSRGSRGCSEELF